MKTLIYLYLFISIEIHFVDIYAHTYTYKSSSAFAFILKKWIEHRMENETAHHKMRSFRSLFSMFILLLFFFLHYIICLWMCVCYGVCFWNSSLLFAVIILILSHENSNNFVGTLTTVLQACERVRLRTHKICSYSWFGKPKLAIICSGDRVGERSREYASAFVSNVLPNVCLFLFCDQIKPTTDSFDTSFIYWFVLIFCLALFCFAVKIHTVKCGVCKWSLLWILPRNSTPPLFQRLWTRSRAKKYSKKNM